MTVAAYLRLESGINAGAWSGLLRAHDLKKNGNGWVSPTGLRLEATLSDDAANELDIAELKISVEDPRDTRRVARLALAVWTITPSWLHADIDVMTSLGVRTSEW